MTGKALNYKVLSFKNLLDYNPLAVIQNCLIFNHIETYILQILKGVSLYLRKQ